MISNPHDAMETGNAAAACRRSKSLADFTHDIYQFRGFITGSVKRDFAARYRNSMLGATWLFLQPLAQILVYTLIFSNIMRSRIPGIDSTYAYSIYLCSGILTWALFTEIIARCQTMFLDNANLLKKLTFPRIALPMIIVASACLGFTIIFALFTGFLILTGNFPGLVYFAVLPVLVIQILLALGIGINIGVLNVFFRDVGQLFVIILQFWFWLTPVVYSMSILPAWAHTWIARNPMTPLILAYQGIFVHAQMPDWGSLLPTFALALVLCAVGLRFFRRRAGEIVDEL